MIESMQNLMHFYVQRRNSPTIRFCYGFLFEFEEAFNVYGSSSKPVLEPNFFHYSIDGAKCFVLFSAFYSSENFIGIFFFQHENVFLRRFKWRYIILTYFSIPQQLVLLAGLCYFPFDSLIYFSIHMLFLSTDYYFCRIYI